MPRHKKWQMYCYTIQNLIDRPSVKANIQGLGAFLGLFWIYVLGILWFIQFKMH